jgi:hypothetical protein
MNAKPPPEPDIQFVERSAKALAAGYAVLTALLTAVASLQGGLGRLLLNRPWLSLLAIGVVLLGIILGFIAAYAWVGRTHVKAVFLIAGLFFFMGGVVGFAWLEQSTLLENERPTITVKSSLGEDAASLDATIAANGVKTTEWIYTVVTGVTKGDSTTIYQTRAGPDEDGKVSVAFTIDVVAQYDFVRVGATRASSRAGEEVDPCFAPDGGSTDHSCATIYRAAPTVQP